MVQQAGFFDMEERLRELSPKGDDIERITMLVDFAMLRAELALAVPRTDGAKGGRPAFDHVLMFKILLLQAIHGLSYERSEYLIKDRLSFMRYGSAATRHGKARSRARHWEKIRLRTVLPVQLG